MDAGVANTRNRATMKSILILLPVLILVLALGLVACSDGYQRGYEEGYEAGSKELAVKVGELTKERDELIAARAYASSYTEAEVIKLCKDELQKVLPRPLVEQNVYLHALVGRWSATWKPTERRWYIKSELAQPYNLLPEQGSKGLIGSIGYYYYEHLKSWEGPSLQIVGYSLGK